MGSSSTSRDETKKKKKKKSSSSSSSSSKRSKRSETKGKDLPGWRVQLDGLLMQAQVHAQELYVKFEKSPSFRQRVMTYGMVAVTVLLVLVVIGRSHGSQQIGLRVSLPSSKSMMSDGLQKQGDMMKKGGGYKGHPLSISKRQREKNEIGFDVSGSDLTSVKRRYTTSKEEYLKAQKAGREKLSSRDEQCFKNMPVQVTRDNPSRVSVYSPRKVFDLAVLQRAHKLLGYVEETDLKKATLVLKGVPRVTFRQLKEGKQYYDMVGSLGRIGSKKKTQLLTLRNHVRKFKCTFESLYIQPRSYDMNRPHDCNKFFQNPDTGAMWVLKSCKSGEGSKGAGISVIDDLSQVRSEWGECKENAFNYVAQAYIQEPLLLNNRKFDMRVYLYVASTKPYVVYFNPGYVRRSLAEYKPTSTEKDDVLTNYHIQMNREDFTPGDAMWGFPQFIQYLKDNDLCEACGDIEIQLAKISRLVFDSGRSYYKRWSGSFQLVGLDFMMDKYLNVQFIEGNVSPGIGNHGLKWKREMMEDLVVLMYEQTQLIHERPQEYDLRIGERVYGKHGHYWELVINEHYEKCNKQMKFDPCQELKLEGVQVPQEDDDAGAADDTSASDASSNDDEED